MAKLLSQLLASIDTEAVIGRTDIEIQDVSYDSRTVAAGTLFICLDGARVDVIRLHKRLWKQVLSRSLHKKISRWRKVLRSFV